MANINITGSGSNPVANNYTVPNPQANSTRVTFHSANSNVTVYFTNEATFGTESLIVYAGQPDAPLTIQSVENTQFCLNSPCTQARKKDVPPYNITMGGGVPGPKHGSEHKK